jgi:hypothetical protein
MEGTSTMHRVVDQLIQWPFLVILSTSVLLALVVPPGVIRALPGLDGILDGVIQHVPATADYIRHSRFPDVAAVYFPLMLIISPLHCLWMWKTMSRGFWTKQFHDHPWQGALRLMAALALVFLIGFATWAEGGGQLEILPWNESRVALALAGYVVAGGGFFIGLTMLALGFRALLATRRAAP